MADGWSDISASEGIPDSRAKINTGFTELTNLHKGTSAPTSAVDGMLWYDSAAGAINIYDGANTAWRTWLPDITATQGGVAAVSSDNAFSVAQTGTAASASGHMPIASQINGQRHSVVVSVDGIAGNSDLFVFAVPESAKYEIVACYLVSDTSTSSSDGSNRYDFKLGNLTEGVDLSSAVVTTNGGEITADSRYALTVDQNNAKADLDAGDILAVNVVKTGSPTDLSSAQVIVQLDYKVWIY